MDKKDIYEHLANIYLDASSKKKKKGPRYRSFRNPFIISLVIILGLSGVLTLNTLHKKNLLKTELALVLFPDVAKINFNFNPAKKEALSINLNKLDLARFKALGFSLKKANFQDTIFLKVEFTSIFKEKSEVYIKGIASKWGDYKVSLADFKNISDWSAMADLSFIVEEWNTREKNGVIYIDNIRLLR